jgi:hypothetical protein
MPATRRKSDPMSDNATKSEFFPRSEELWDEIPPQEANVTLRKPYPKVKGPCPRCGLVGMLELTCYNYIAAGAEIRCPGCKHRSKVGWEEVQRWERGLETI